MWHLIDYCLGNTAVKCSLDSSLFFFLFFFFLAENDFILYDPEVYHHLHNINGFPTGSAIKNLSAIQETQVWSLGGEDPLEEGMATHSSILAWRFPGTEESGALQSMRSQRVRRNWATKHTCTQFKGFVSNTYFSISLRVSWEMWSIQIHCGHHNPLVLLSCAYSAVITSSVVSGSLLFCFFLNGPALTLGHCNLL